MKNACRDTRRFLLKGEADFVGPREENYACDASNDFKYDACLRVNLSWRCNFDCRYCYKHKDPAKISGPVH